jgi:flagellar hook-associated protein 1 FlgK
MSTLNGILNTGLAGLYAQQAGISVTGDNITNVNTDGYSRQSLELSSSDASGVTATGVSRLTDKYATAQLYGSNARLAEYETTSTNLSQIESILGTGDSGGLVESLESFFSSLEDLSADSSSSTNRYALLNAGSSLASKIDTTATQLAETRQGLDDQVVSDVDTVNNLSSQIAAINTQLLAFPASNGTTATDSARNALEDQRDTLVGQLSSLASITTATDDHNQMSIYVGGQALVYGASTHQLKAVANSDNDNLHDVVLETSAGGDIVLNDSLSSGELGGLLQARDDEAGTALDKLDKLSATMARDFNVQHEAGTGLDGSHGLDLFDGLAATASADSNNTGGAKAASASITDLSALTFDDYQIQFTDSGTYDVVDKTTGTTLSTGNAYTSGTAVAFDGISVTLADSTGTPAAGDVFSVNSYSGTASRLSLSSDVEGNTNAVACGTSMASGDTTNVTSMLALRDQASIDGQTYEEYYKNLCVQVGTDSATASSQAKSESDTNTQLASLASSTSGVSLDEEATNLIKYQNAYEAAGKLVSTVNQMMNALLQMI